MDLLLEESPPQSQRPSPVSPTEAQVDKWDIDFHKVQDHNLGILFQSSSHRKGEHHHVVCIYHGIAILTYASSLPEMFFTTQKSAERSIMMMMKLPMKEFVMKDEPRYIVSAATLNTECNRTTIL